MSQIPRRTLTSWLNILFPNPPPFPLQRTQLATRSDALFRSVTVRPASICVAIWESSLLCIHVTLKIVMCIYDEYTNIYNFAKDTNTNTNIYKNARIQIQIQIFTTLPGYLLQCYQHQFSSLRQFSPFLLKCF